MKRAITYSSLLDYVFDTIGKAYKKHTIYPYLPLMINLKYLYDKYDITDDQDNKLKNYLVDYLGCKEVFNHIFSTPAGYINIDKNQIGVIDIKRNSDEIAGLINISYSVFKKINKDGNVPSTISVSGYISPELIDELDANGVSIYEKKPSVIYKIYIKNPEEIKFANYKGAKIMYREVSTVSTEEKELQVNMANIINTYDVLKVQQQNVRSTKLVKGLKTIQRAIPNETFREVDVVLDIDTNVQAKINQVLMKYHMTMCKKYRVDNTYTVMCNCLTSNANLVTFKTAMIIHNPDNNIQPLWESYTKARIGTTNNDDKSTTTDKATTVMGEMLVTAEENDFDSIPSADAMRKEADLIAKNIDDQRKEIARGLRYAAKHGEYSWSTHKVVYGCIVKELKAKKYKVSVLDGVTTISCK